MPQGHLSVGASGNRLDRAKEALMPGSGVSPSGLKHRASQLASLEPSEPLSNLPVPPSSPPPPTLNSHGLWCGDMRTAITVTHLQRWSLLKISQV